MSVKIKSDQLIVTGLLEQRTPVSFRAGGPSMSPTIRDSDTVSIRPLEPHDLRCGAILLYRKNDRLVLHRLVQKNKKFFFCGDAALTGLDAVEPENILGTATGVQRAGRILALDTPAQRFYGRLRYRLRPLRRLMLKMIFHRSATS